jgi:hypothetical protein
MPENENIYPATKVKLGRLYLDTDFPGKRNQVHLVI